ncbi:MAG TPA: molybdate ABC transporter substrate-binding protein [Nocardioidaceae bacterium]|nr:molybdate ABC transporter substrate-binding protein [Nocardioidaceae bacterium]
MRPVRPIAAAVAAALLALLAGCATNGSATTGSRHHAGTLTVLAAASLTESFTDLAHAFEKQHPGVHVRLSFDSSATLAEQITQGAPADVLATADTRTMHTVVAAHDTAAAPRLFATNTLVLVVPKRNPGDIETFADIEKPGVSYVMCVPSAPCGALTRQELAADHVTAKPASQEVDVKAVLTKVSLGQADAGFVYATDADSAQDKVEVLPIPNSAKFVNQYPIVAIKGSDRPDLARAWVDLVLSDRGQKVLADYGFGSP